MSMRYSFITKVALVITLIFSVFCGINSYRKSLAPDYMVDNSKLEVLAIPGSTLSSIIRGNGTAEEMLDFIEIGKNAISKYPHETPPGIGNRDRVYSRFIKTTRHYGHGESLQTKRVHTLLPF
ncbi:hypothetical protein [Enterobacter sp. MGH 24]|uniref:hypothetical protein n=1 Tax=Enterobacter sp. MGH 24 TaxID=1329828 RepID=UPI0012DFAE5D|nr:hypothetical protein [Enterobacter sp. MGH 24]